MDITLTQDNFDEMAQKHDVLVIYFCAKWCSPCKSFSRVFTKVAEDYPGIAFAKVDVDEQKSLAEEFSVQSVPAIMILRNNVVVFAETGSLGATSLDNLVQQAQALTPDQL